MDIAEKGEPKKGATAAAQVLLVDNDPSILNVLNNLLSMAGYEVACARDGQEALALARTSSFNLIVSDLRMQPMDGMELLRRIRGEQPEVSVIMLTAYGTVETAIESMKLGAFDYITKPFKPDELLMTVQRALEYRAAMLENADLRARLGTRYRLENVVAESPSMKKLCELIERIGPTDASILIYGESGTGKEVVAKAVHACSLRSDGRFLAVNCAALPGALLESEMFGHVKGAFTGASADKIGLFEAAEGGTLLLDEIGSMPLDLQGKLLRVLQEREVRRVGDNSHRAVDVRVLAATNTDLEEMMLKGTFREDLYYRLCTIPITVDPLRDRKEDIAPLVHHVIRDEYGPSHTLPEVDPDVYEVFEAYGWPGNVRELENAVKHSLALARGERITRDVLPSGIVNAVESGTNPTNGPPRRLQPDELRPLKTFLRQREREYITRVLRSAGGNKEKAAGILGISLASLYRKLSSEQVQEPPQA